MLKAYLMGMGYEVAVTNDGTSGLNEATTGTHYDLILLDVMMPGMDGFDVLKQLRVSHSTPVLMLTARGDDYDRILGLELGADDYLPKPFNHRELAARIKAIFRRQELTTIAQHQQDIHVNGIMLSSTRQLVEVDGTGISLTGTEFSVLRLLMVQAGNLVTKDDISKKALGKKLMAFDRSIDMHVSNLRKKIGAIASDEKIRTVRGAGYLMKVSA